MPDNVEDVVYSIIKTDTSLTIQVYFKDDFVPVNYRIRQNVDGLKDISGMYFEQSVEKSYTIKDCDGKMANNLSKEGNIYWYDASSKLLHSISVNAGATEEFLNELASSTSVSQE